MKKLLILLSISTLTASLPAPLLAKTPLGRDIDKTTVELIRNKRESEQTYELKLKKGKFLIEKMTNVKKTYDFSLKIESIPKKDVSDWTQKFITFQNQADNEYVEISKWMFFNENSNVYNNLINSNFDLKKQTKFDFNKNITLNLLKHNGSKSFMIEIVNIEIERDSKDNLEWVKQQSQFNLSDNSKKKTWTHPDLITVDGVLNIAIANPNIDKVIFDNVQQSQTNKQWTINVKPEIAPRDHRLQVSFTLDGKPYTSEITVSIQAKIEAPAPGVKQNLRALVKNTELENLFDNNNETIMAAINQKNANAIDDTSQLEITNKEGSKATLTAKPDSTSYAGSVEVTYNVVPATIVDLQIELQPITSEAIVVKDYVGQIDPTNIPNPVQTFFYANSESTITIKKPTARIVITGFVYGCDAQWNKTVQSINIDETNGIKLDGSQLDTKNGKYVVELGDNLGHTNNLYLQIAPEKAIKNYFDTDNGKQFAIWAQANGHDNIRGTSARRLNNLFAAIQTWPPQANGSENTNIFDPKTANNNLPNNNKSGLTG
ncbi:adhesin [Spiroplasma endosymbiont of Eupeodes luniger]|uniref:adhesin n=1 Tax=Spiroplasma endosymbiont of Eupeodes luniger TaxID=3066300 RepID=UPI0030CAC074